MRIFSCILVAATSLCATIGPGWCPEPADLKAPPPIGATGADIPGANLTPYPQGGDPNDPENMTRAQRLQLLSREKAAGRITTDQQVKNFLETGNPNKVWTRPPAPKPLVKPKSMSDAQWQRVLATRAKPQDYVKGEYGNGMEGVARRQGGSITVVPAPAPTTTPAKTANPAPASSMPPRSAAEASADEMNKLSAQPKRYQPVTKLGVHPTQAQPAPGVSALDRMTGVSNSAAPAGNKSNTRLGARHTNAPQMVPRNFITLPAQRSQDTFRQPK